MKRFFALVLFAAGFIAGAVGQTHSHTYASPGSFAGVPYGTTTATVMVLGRYVEADGRWWIKYKVIKNESGSGASKLTAGFGGGYSPYTSAFGTKGISVHETRLGSSGLFPAATASVFLASQLEKIDGGYQAELRTEVFKPSSSDQKKQVHLGLVNPSAEYATTFKIFQDGVQIDSVVVPKSSSQSAIIEVPSTANVTVQAFVNGLTKDGNSWVDQPSAVTDLGPVGSQSGAPITPTTTDPPPVTPMKPPTGIPSGNKTSEEEKAIWAPDATTTALTKAVYREGVDKITGKIGDVANKLSTTNTKLGEIKDSLTNAPPGFEGGDDLPSEADPADVPVMPSAAQVDGLGAKIPAMPTITNPGSVSSFSFALAIPRVGTKTFAVDLSEYESGINVFKWIVRAALALMFWWAVVDNIRKAVAN